MVSEYLSAALHKARYEILPDDSSYYGEIPGFEGVYANAASLETCREELREVLEEWVLLRVSRSLPLPVVDGLELTIRATAEHRQSRRSGLGAPPTRVGSRSIDQDVDRAPDAALDATPAPPRS